MLNRTGSHEPGDLPVNDRLWLRSMTGGRVENTGGRYALLSVCCRDMPCVRIDLFFSKDPDGFTGSTPETGQCFTHDYLHRSAANCLCSRERFYLLRVVILSRAFRKGVFFYEKKVCSNLACSCAGRFYDRRLRQRFGRWDSCFRIRRAGSCSS